MLHRKEVLRARRLARIREHEARNAAAVAGEEKDLKKKEAERRTALAEDRERRRREHAERNAAAAAAEPLRGVKMRRPDSDKMLRPTHATKEEPNSFASSSAEELAKQEVVTMDELASVPRSGARGYTVDDVRAAVARREPKASSTSTIPASSTFFGVLESQDDSEGTEQETDSDADDSTD